MQQIKKIIPSILKDYFRVLIAFRIYLYDFFNDFRYCNLVKRNGSSKDSCLANAAIKAHTIEKGLTMPQKRFNFGHDKLEEIFSNLLYCYKHFDCGGERFADIVGILKEYHEYHEINKIEISDRKIQAHFRWLYEQFPAIQPTRQIYGMSRDALFSKDKQNDFSSFAKSRHSCRNFSNNNLDMDKLKKALDLCILTTPSACNRQSVRVHVLSSKDILNIQQGNRGFGHLADKYLLVTSSLSYWPSVDQRNGPYVDGGIFVMNLLYCLHYYEIGAITLNMYLDVKRTGMLHRKLSIPQNEVPVALIAVGIPASEFDVARSTRMKENVICWHGCGCND